jgi:hypothetical protein
MIQIKVRNSYCSYSTVDPTKELSVIFFLFLAISLFISSVSPLQYSAQTHLSSTVSLILPHLWRMFQLLGSTVQRKITAWTENNTYSSRPIFVKFLSSNCFRSVVFVSPGGLVVIVLAIGPKVRGFKPGRGWIKKVPLYAMEALGGREGIVPTHSRPLHIPHGERTAGTHWTGGWVGPRAGLDSRGWRKNPFTSAGIESRSPGRPVRSQTLYWLSYPGTYDGFLRAIKIRSTSFRAEVKPSAPCRKILCNVKRYLQYARDTCRQHSRTFLAQFLLLCYYASPLVTVRELWWMNQESLELWWGNKRSVMVAAYGAPCAVPPSNSNQ